MLGVVLKSETDFDGWRAEARRLLMAEVRPQDVVWSVGGATDLLASSATPPPASTSPFTVPRAFIELAETAILHSDPQRFARLYRLLWRLREKLGLLQVSVDADVAGVEAMAKSVRRDIHKMRAFVRFRQAWIGQDEWHVAWFEPEHHILERNAPFFVRRFANMRWSILTPEASAHWDGETLAIAPGATRDQAPTEDAMEDLWRDYYASIFNPARLKIGAMRSEMPVKYWRNLPEARLIAPLIEDAQRRSDQMVATGTTAPNARPQRLPRGADISAPQAGTLEALRAEAMDCRACPLWAPATQTVFGEGPSTARVVIVGEQPGDQEDLVGHPFVGPAGKMLDKAMAEAGVDRTKAYVTNAVKHFKFVPRGKRRIHSKPDGGEIRACRPWVERELDLIKPDLVIAMGATAAQSLFGRAMPIGKNRGRVLGFQEGGAQALITVHPSYLLRLPDEDAKAEAYAQFVRDLKLARPFFAQAA